MPGPTCWHHFLAPIDGEYCFSKDLMMSETKERLVRSEPLETHQESHDLGMRQEKVEAVYALESPVKCPHCGETIAALKAVRLLRNQVNFTSTLPRRGRVTVCPDCHAIVPAELTNF